VTSTSRYNRGVRVDEHELIRRAQGGDQDAFAQLVVMHAARVMSLLRRFGLTAAEADEVGQEVFLRAWRGLPRFEERAQFSTWLYRIAFNEAKRRLARRPPLQAEPNADHDDVVAALPASPLQSPDAVALEHEFERTLERALAQLPAEWREAVVLRDLQALSTRDAAAVAGVREAAFKSRLHRGRMQLRVLLEPYLELGTRAT
jgi:RNA polymerase sigma-70 factor (ECF subfamily)